MCGRFSLSSLSLSVTVTLPNRQISKILKKKYISIVCTYMKDIGMYMLHSASDFENPVYFQVRVLSWPL